jgi:hypothetical protein
VSMNDSTPYYSVAQMSPPFGGLLVSEIS